MTPGTPVIHLTASYNPAGWEANPWDGDIIVLPKRARISAFVVCAPHGEYGLVMGELVRTKTGGIRVRTKSSKRRGKVRWVYYLTTAAGQVRIIGDWRLWEEWCSIREQRLRYY